MAKAPAKAGHHHHLKMAHHHLKEAHKHLGMHGKGGAHGKPAAKKAEHHRAAHKK